MANGPAMHARPVHALVLRASHACLTKGLGYACLTRGPSYAGLCSGVLLHAPRPSFTHLDQDVAGGEVCQGM